MYEVYNYTIVKCITITIFLSFCFLLVSLWKTIVQRMMFRILIVLFMTFKIPFIQCMKFTIIQS